ncbi:Lrp/AsnC family transcriptional regulator [Streptomyces sp. ODS28]|uniref:Lrp/AsnC family transcriptional regulator n=1 Tax=Streptomyces sp. ODS28 TaxID=3136688 RepID=UPI0031E82628
MAENTELDSVDLAILEHLQNDARVPNKDLAARVGVAPSTALQRVRALLRRGVIRAVRAVVDPAALGRPLHAFLQVRMRVHTRDLVGPFRAFVLGQPETVALYHVAGPEDFVVHVAVPDQGHLQRLILDGFTSRPEVAHVQTILIFESAEREVQLPVPPRT